MKLYFRRGAHRRSLHSPDGSQALRDEVDSILAELGKVDRAKTPLPGTVGGMIKAYNASADFLGLARSTQADYQRLLDEIDEDAGDVLLIDVTPAWIVEMKNAWASRGYRAANLRLQMLVNALEPAIVDNRIRADPFLRLKKVKRPHDAPEPHPIWSDDEVDALIALAMDRKMPGLARAVALGRWAGFRRGGICSIPLQALITGYDPEGRPHRRIYWLTQKRKVICDKPEDPRLTAFLAKTPNRALTIAYNARNGPWRERQLNQAIDRLIEALAGQGKVRPNLTIHGLRHTRGVELAEAGASDSEIMSQLEHRDGRTAQIYRRQAERRKLADSAQAKVDAVVRLRLRG
ncbi:MAG TPA: site-specific integrase [Caulobacteraceae bacterium]|nr:site-specific integrase [Caulobacteraceae bacterium]